MTNFRKLCTLIIGKVTGKGRIWKITRKQTIALQQCLHFLKIHSLHTGMFLSMGNPRTIQKILLQLNRGDQSITIFLHEQCSPRDCATAVNTFLLRKRPLLPARVQKLLAANNQGVSPKMIALDALGLILQEFYNTNNLKVLHGLLDVMKVLSTVGSLRPTEIKVSYAPYVLLPLFFEERPEVLMNWKQVCDTLNEMVIMTDLLLTPEKLSRTVTETKKCLVVDDSQSTRRKNVTTLKNPTYFRERSVNEYLLRATTNQSD